MNRTMNPSSEQRSERWYEFEQIEVLSRPYFVKAASVREARAKVRGSGGLHCGVADYAPDGAHTIKVIGPGRLAGDQEWPDDLERERRS